MNAYVVPHDPRTLAALNLLANGVVFIEIAKDFPDSRECVTCCLRLPEGRWIQIEVAGVDLEYKFEVFQISAHPVDAPRKGEIHSLTLKAPVEVTPLVTQSWLDPTVEAGPTVGVDPIVQFVGKPGTVPATASVSCRYLGGVELKDSDGKTFVIVAGSFPYSLHVSGYYEDRYFQRQSYVALPVEERISPEVL